MILRFKISSCEEEGVCLEGDTGLPWFHTTLRVLYADTDRSGVVYHANYLKYFEVGRAALMRASGFPYKEVEAGGYTHPIVELGINFQSYARYDDLLRVYSRPKTLERVRFIFDYRITNEAGDRVLVYGFTRHCCLSPKLNPVAVDPETVALFRKYGAVET